MSPDRPAGRAVRVTPPAKNGLSSGFPMITAYERCDGNQVNCGSDAKIRVGSSQSGSPQSAVYLDSLGRTIRTATQLLGNAPNYRNFSDLNTSVTESRFNDRGLLQWQYEPARSSPNPSATTQFDYDALARPILKRQTFKKVSADAVVDPSSSFGPYQVRRTEYSHVGLSTAIFVCERSNSDLSCSAPTQPDQAQSLPMCQ